MDTAATSLRAPFPLTARAYANTWNAYDRTLNRPPRSVPGQSAQTVRKTYYLDANVLKASEDKTFPGAVVASLASPWGQAINAGDDVNGEPVYYGSYREIFARDSYEAFTGFLADGDLATARAQARFLLDDQQLPTGEIPRNSLLNGKAAPDTGGDQLDETADPILMAYLSGLGGDDALWTEHIKPAADFLVAHGPSFGVERWEEQSGYSPSTIAAEIAGLTAAAAIATEHHDAADAAVYQATADDFQRNVQSWTVTSTGPDSTSPYFLRLSKTGDPNAAITYNLSNGGPTVAQDTVIDGGFQELVRLGELVAERLGGQELAVRPRQARSRSRPRPAPATTGTAPTPPTAAPTATVTATSPARPPARPWASRGRRPTSAPGTCGRCCRASAASPRSPRAIRPRPRRCSPS